MRAPNYKELDKSVEADLCERFQAGDSEAITVLVKAHEPFLRMIAHRYARLYQIDVDDMMQECRTGVTIAASKFKRGHNVRFLTYASYWARHCAGRAGQDQAGAFRVPVHMQTTNRAHPQRGVSLSLPAYPDGPETLCDVIRCNGPTAEENAVQNEDETWLRGVIDSAIDSLPERTQFIVRAHLMNDANERGFMTLKELGDRFGLTRERIRQIEAKAKRKIATAIEYARQHRAERHR
jgi:RNA polymerase sigma factor (sigma-70 family)